MKRFADLSVKSKYIIVHIFLVFLPFCVFGIAFANAWNRQEVREEQEEDLRKLKRAAEDIDAFFEKVKNAAEQLYLDEDVNGIVRGYGNKNRYTQTMDKIKNIISDNEKLGEIQILVDGIVEYQSGNLCFSEFGNEEYVWSLQQKHQIGLWAETHILYQFQKGGFTKESRVCSYYSNIYDLNAFTSEGVLGVHFLESELEEFYVPCMNEDTELVWMADQEGKLFSASDKKYFEQGLPAELAGLQPLSDSGCSVVRIEGKKYNVLWSQCAAFDGFLYKIDREKDAYAMLKMYIFLIIVICAAFCAVCLFIQEKYVNSPLRKLSAQMEKVKGGALEMEELPAGNDEIGKLIRLFYDMLEQINKLIKTVYIEQINKQKIELDSVIIQISPHFLYNTLDSIRWTALANEDEDVGEQLEALSGVLRGILNFGEKKVTVRQELEIINNYYFLIQKRFRRHIQMEQQAEEGVLSCEISRLLIQPLVENAVVHGLQPKHGNGKIWVIIRMKRQKLHIVVMDNGKGCRGEEVRREMENPYSRKCFALNNIRQRIQLEYGEDGSLRFLSKEGKGTFVKIEIPIEE